MALYTPVNTIHWMGESNITTLLALLRDLRKVPANTTAGHTEVANASYNVVCKNCKSMPGIKHKEELDSALPLHAELHFQGAHEEPRAALLIRDQQIRRTT